MKYYIIAGEASGDLHGSNLMKALKVEDASAERFMRQFYKRWLSQLEGENDAAAALDKTREYYIENEPDFDWSPYVLIGV